MVPDVVQCLLILQGQPTVHSAPEVQLEESEVTYEPRRHVILLQVPDMANPVVLTAQMVDDLGQKSRHLRGKPGPGLEPFTLLTHLPNVPGPVRPKVRQQVESAEV
jgi:hypothetical protein